MTTTDPGTVSGTAHTDRCVRLNHAHLLCDGQCVDDALSAPVSPDLATLRAMLDGSAWVGNTVVTPTRGRVDVTDRLTPGARAAAIERTRVAAMLQAGADRATVAARRGFDDGRAWQRGADAATTPRQGDAVRRDHALAIAGEYLDAHDPRRAALVLAGFAGVDPAEVA